MKKLLIAISLCVVFVTVTNAQNILSKVPADASLVVKYAGENFSNLLPIEKLDSYNFIKKDFFKLLGVDSLTSIKNMGINLEQDNYQYAISKDSTVSFVTIMHIKNALLFSQFIKKSYSTKTETIDKNGFNFLTISGNTYVGWNQSMAVIVNTSYQNKISYYTHKYAIDTVKVVTDSATAITADSAMSKAVEEAVKKVKKSNPKIYKNGYKKPTKKRGTKQRSTTKRSTTKRNTKRKVEKKKKYEYGIAETTAATYDPIADSIESRNQDLWDQQQDKIAKQKQQTRAESIINTTLNENVITIENEVEYKKIVEPAAHISVWINNDKLTNLYQSYYMGSIYNIMTSANALITRDTTPGFKTALNIYFDNDKLRLEQKTFSADATLSNLSKAVLSSKQNSSFVNLVNPGNIGYFSVSSNTEAMLHYYYTLLKKYMSSNTYMAEYADLANTYIDLLDIMIDEKGIADLMTGNYLFVMHSLDYKLVNYNDYTYDSEYNKKDVKKTKKELSPNFTFALETRREDFMEKLAKLPLKYAKKNKYDYKDKGGYYELVLDSGKYPLSSLYFMVKDGKAIVTTNKDVVSMVKNNTAFAIDEVAKKSILNNSNSVKLDTKKLFEILATEASTKSNKKIFEYLQNNIADIKAESNFKDGMIQGTTIMNITGKHSNSLEFFFNMVDEVNAIMENEKAEELKRAD